MDGIFHTLTIFGKNAITCSVFNNLFFFKENILKIFSVVTFLIKSVESPLS